MQLTTAETIEICDVLDRAADIARSTPTPESDADRERLAGSCDLVIHEITGLRERIARASKKINGTPQPLPKKPHNPKPKPDVHPKPQSPPKEDQ